MVQARVIDNLSTHKVKEIRDIIEKTGVKIIYLSPNSPDFNPHMFPIKIRRAHNEYNIVSIKELHNAGRRSVGLGRRFANIKSALKGKTIDNNIF